MKRNLIILFSLLLLSVPAAVLAAGQACSETIPLSAPSENFIVEADGTVFSKTTGLIWMRCSIGQTWDGKSCTGDSTLFAWSAALKAAVDYQYAGFNDWRLPNKNELESLVEVSCTTPAINEKVFPATPLAFFWTGSPYTGVTDGVWSVDFAYGTVVASEKIGKNYVRLVRDR